MIRLQVQLTEEQVAGLREVARHRKGSLAGLVREAVDRFLAATPYQTIEEQWAVLRSLAGRYRSGSTDVAERHDEYLAEDRYRYLHGDPDR